jgi:queuine tRNA-ribosyltransferase
MSNSNSNFQKCFKINKTCTGTNARTGVLEIRGRKAKTPFFMPVATKAVGKCIGSMDYKKIGVQALIANSLVLYLNPGLEMFRKSGGIHKFMNFDGIIFTDSGGFQMIRDGFFLQRSKRAVHFKDPATRQKHVMTPQKVMDTALAINPDVAMVLDDLAPANADYEHAKKSMIHTHDWAAQAIIYHESKDPEHNQKVFCISQGCFFDDLRSESSKYINTLNCDGVAIGGLAVGETREKMLNAVSVAVKNYDEDKIKYMMGVGNPLDIVNLVDLGCDCFDSIFPTQNARHGTLFTMNGKLDIMKGTMTHDQNPVDLDCDCDLCKHFSRSYIKYLLRNKDPEGKRLASIHNIRFMMRFMEKLRDSIEAGTFIEFRDHIRKVYASNNDVAGSQACTLD